VLVQIAASKGDIVLKMPLFDDRIHQALEGC